MILRGGGVVQNLNDDEPGNWVVDVEDVRDVEKNLPGYRRRFLFEGPDAADKAWACLIAAETHGFRVDVQKVKKGPMVSA